MKTLGTFLGFVMHHLLRYRRKVVRDNLVKSFPEMSDVEIEQIEKRFYRNFGDLVAEMLKMKHWGLNELSMRVKVVNPEVMESLYAKGKSVLVATQHSSNWEWLAKILFTTSNHHHFAIYKKLKSPYFDRLVYRLRSNHCEPGVDYLIEDRAVKDVLEAKRGELNTVLILGDQSPRGVETDFWTPFLHRDTCWYTGLERLAKRFDYAVVYAEMRREARGNYSLTFKLITEDPLATDDGFILEQYVRHVERFIQAAPDNWLWSHRRWKHSREKVA